MHSSCVIDPFKSSRSGETGESQSGEVSKSGSVSFVEKEGGAPGTANPVENTDESSKAVATEKKEGGKEKKMSEKEKAKLERKRQQEEAAKKKLEEERANVWLQFSSHCSFLLFIILGLCKAILWRTASQHVPRAI